MAEITGLDSILEISHFKTDRKNKYSFGKSQRFTPLKSSYVGFYLDTLSIFMISLPQKTREHVRLVMEANIILCLQLTIQVLQPTSCFDKNRQAYHSA